MVSQPEVYDAGTRAGKPLIRGLHDGYLDGVIPKTAVHCGYCHSDTIGVEIHKVTLPNGIEAERTILKVVASNKLKASDTMKLGIGCGCYSKFHRQVAHITSKMEARKNAHRRTS